MAEKKWEPTVSVDMVKIFSRHVTRAGLSFERICHAAGIDPAAIEISSGRIPGRQFETIWQEALFQSNDPDFGLHVGQAVSDAYAGGHLLFNVMKNSPNVKQAMEKFFCYHGLMADIVRPEIRQTKEFASISWNRRSTEIQPSRHIDEALLCTFTQVLRHISDNRADLIEIRFQHQRPVSIHTHRRIFNAPLRFEKKASELVFSRDAFELPVFGADPEFLENLEQFAQKILSRIGPFRTWSDRVSTLLGKMLVRGENLKIETVAAKLAVSKRTLQSRLKEERTTYQQIRDTFKKKMAISYLRQTQANICDIAFLLGYSEQSAFNHAFKRWTGKTPVDFLKRRRNVV